MPAVSPHPPLAFDERGTPFSTLFQDVFRSRGRAVEEAREVFVDGCELPSRWSGATSCGQTGGERPFTILELGFGAGVNFLVTLAQWRQAAVRGVRLHYVSIEAHPLSPDDLRRAIGWPDYPP